MNVRDLVDHPDDVQRFQVFADQLVEQGDPRGELMAVQLKLEHQPGDAALKARAEKLLADHLPQWVGDLATLLNVTARGKRPGVAPLALGWRRGFLDSVRVGPPTDQYETSNIDFPETIKKVLALTNEAFLRELVIGAMEFDDYPTSWQACVDAIAESEVPESLRRLEFSRGGYWDISSTELGDLSAAYPQLKNLTELRIELGAFELGELNLPNLRTLEFITGGLTNGNIQSVIAGGLPSLEKLTLYVGTSDGDHGCQVTFDGLAPIFAATNLSKVQHLALANSSLADEIAAALPASKILPQLKSLDLSRGTMSDEGARALLANRKAFAHLERLDLTRNFLSEAILPELATLAREVIVADQEDSDDDYRYVAISE